VTVVIVLVARVRLVRFSRKDAKSKKFEARKKPRGPKFETNSNDQKSGFNVPNGPVSDFDIRILEFDSVKIGSSEFGRIYPHAT